MYHQDSPRNDCRAREVRTTPNVYKTCALTPANVPGCSFVDTRTARTTQLPDNAPRHTTTTTSTISVSETLPRLLFLWHSTALVSYSIILHFIPLSSFTPFQSQPGFLIFYYVLQRFHVTTYRSRQQLLPTFFRFATSLGFIEAAFVFNPTQWQHKRTYSDYVSLDDCLTIIHQCYS